MKICAGCKNEKDESYFNKTQLGRFENGRNSGKCKDCVLNYNKKYRDNNKEHIKHLRKKCYIENKDKILNDSKIYYLNNKEKISQVRKIYYKNNKDYFKKYSKKYYQENKKDIKIYSSNYRKNNLKIILSKNNLYKKNKLKKDPIYKLYTNISRIVNHMLKGKKAGKSTKKILPFTEEQLIKHMEGYFNKPGNEWMNWENQGFYNIKTWNNEDKSTWVWNLDHIKPISHFDIQEPGDVEFRACWDLSNLRPLSAKQNILDGNRR